MGNMAIGPGRMFPRRRAGGVKKALLGKHDIRRGRYCPRMDIADGGGNLVEGAAQMNRGGFPADIRSPGNRLMKSPIHFINARSVTEPAKPFAVRFGETQAFDLEQLTGGDIEEIT